MTVGQSLQDKISYFILNITNSDRNNYPFLFSSLSYYYPVALFRSIAIFPHVNEFLKAQMKRWKAVHIWNLITLKVETKGSGVQDPPELHSESETYRLQKNTKCKTKQKTENKRKRK